MAIFALLLAGLPSDSHAQEPILKLTPQQCVALTQGQKCYVDATLLWETANKGNYCLYSSQQAEPLFCWQQKRQGQFKSEVGADKNVVFSLRLENSEQDTASQQLKVTWVHQKRGQPRLWWRIF